MHRRVIEVDDDAVQDDEQLEIIRGLAQTSELKAAKKAKEAAKVEALPEEE